MTHSQENISSRTTPSRRSKKRKQDDVGENADMANEDSNTARKQKRRRPLPPPTTGEQGTTSAVGKGLIAETPELYDPIEGEDHRNDGKRPKRFIVFIGNLPFTATTASISKHFASLKPVSIRHITHKEKPTVSKGYAFLEFDGYDRMKTCLKLLHQSTFDDGLSAARKINVELTAGGGGAKSKERRTKLKAKNQKLNEERKRRSQEEEKARQDKRNNAGDASSIHPSRRGMVAAG
ncbi:hypothetical protein GP486_002016 [Trichoglossum hirsutum]|uniref:RRM domain-containing protein n=1 Tax=Trichoglossum hirsutum TaxID=265104 RepID=A0A9P8LFS6_9PEZI|nr:hypothetical protein GP486_002016 [Trichoglossum hirsutum]